MKNRAIFYFLIVLLVTTGCGQTPSAPRVTATPTSITPTVTSTAELQAKNNNVAISPDNAADLKLLRTIDETRGRVWTLAFSGDGAHFASSDRNDINVWDLSSNQRAFAFDIRELDLNSFVFSPDSRLLATAQTIWDVQSREVLQRLDTPGLLHPAFSPDGKLLAVSGVHPIKIWDVASGQLVRTFDEQTDNHSFSIAFSPDGTLLADSGRKGRITLWDVVSGQVVRNISNDGIQNDVHDIAFSPDGKLLVSVGTDYTVRLWEVSSGQVLQTMMQGNGLYGVAFSPDGRLVASAGCDRTVKLWDVASGRMVASLRHGDEGHIRGFLTRWRPAGIRQLRREDLFLEYTG
jgi:WD40 repeat protein